MIKSVAELSVYFDLYQRGLYMYILAMSRNKKDIKYYLQDRADKVFVHICKILLYPKSPYVGHWEHEIYAFISNIQKLKGSNKLPSKSFIQNILLQELDSMIGIYMKQAIADEDDADFTDVDESYANKICEQYVIWLAEKLSTDGFVSNKDVKAKLHELIFR